MSDIDPADIPGAIVDSAHAMPTPIQASEPTPSASANEVDPADIPGALIDPADIPGAITDNPSTEAKQYTSAGQTAAYAAEQFGEGFAGPAFTYAEMHSGLTTPEARIKREQYGNPALGSLANIAGGIAGLVGPGELAAVGKAGEALAGLTKFGKIAAMTPEAAEIAGMTGSRLWQKVAAGGLKGLTEMTLLGAGNESSRNILNDPNSVQTAATHMGLDALLGLGVGATFGGAGALLNSANAKALSRELEAAKGQFDFNMNHLHPVEEGAKELSAHFNDLSAAYNDAHGIDGLKDSIIQKTVPKTITPEIISQQNDILARAESSLAKMRAKPSMYPAGLVDGFADDIETFKRGAFPKEAEVPSATEHFLQKSEMAAVPKEIPNPEYEAKRQTYLNSLDPYDKGPTSEEITKAIGDIPSTISNPAWNTPQPPDIGPSNVDRFRSQQTLKQMVQGYSKTNQFIDKINPAYHFVQEMRSLSPIFRQSLEDTNVWGDAGQFQQTINKAWSNLKPFKDKLTSYFTDTIPAIDGAGNTIVEPKVSLPKMQTYMNQAGRFTDTSKKTVLDGYLKQSQKFADAVNPSYEAIGEISPFSPAPTPVLSRSLGELSPGMEAVNIMTGKYLSHAAAVGTGAGIGGSLGTGLGIATGIPFGGTIGGGIGTAVGAAALGPMLEKLLPVLGKAFFEKSASFPGMAWAGRTLEAAAKGTELMSKSAKNVFKAGAEVLPLQAMASPKGLKRLDTRLVAAQENPQQFAENMQNNPLGYYMPDHAQALSQMLANNIQYINSKRPDNAFAKAPLDQARQPSSIQKDSWNNLLRIAQQPLTMMNKVKQGTVTPEDIQHVTSMYPAAWTQMQSALSQAMTEHIDNGGTIPYKTRIGLSLALGHGVDSTLTGPNIMAAQPQAQQPQAPAPQKGKKGSTKDLGKVAQQAQTPTQAMQARAARNE